MDLEMMEDNGFRIIDSSEGGCRLKNLG